MTLRFEVLGIDPANKGAQLMLAAVREQLQERFPGHCLALSLDFPAEERLAVGAWTCVRRERLPLARRLRAAMALMPAPLRASLGLLLPDDVDVVLDASGFAYGDFWGAEKIRRRVIDRLKRWRRPGRIAVMLPQALGPFTGDEIRSTMAEALSCFDLVFARDRESLAHLRSLAPDHAAITLAPDFTNLLHPHPLPAGSSLAGQAYIVPNAKILASRGAADAQSYEAFLRLAATKLREAGERPAFLIHEGKGDLEIAERVNATLGEPVSVVANVSALEAKAIIASAGVVISSRFHGLVSALACGVPAFACGWSHKYGKLMSDYGCGEFNLTLSDSAGAEAALGNFLSRAAEPGFRQKLSDRADAEREKSVAMWDCVDAAIRAVRAHAI